MSWRASDPREILLARGQSDLAALVRRAYPRLAQTRSASTTSPSPFPPWPTLGPGWIGTPWRAPHRRAWLPAVSCRYVRATPALGAAARGAPGAVSAATIPGHRRAGALAPGTHRNHAGAQTQGSLLDTLDVTATAMGGRLLRRWLLFPLLDLARIRRRHDAIERLVEKQSAREASRKILSELGDVERLVSRARLGVASPRDVVVLGRSLSSCRSGGGFAAGRGFARPRSRRTARIRPAGPGPDLAQDIADRIRGHAGRTTRLPSPRRAVYPIRRIGRIGRAA